MSSEFNPRYPYDQTIWGPIYPEQAIEDPLHGAEAVMGLLSIPPFRNPDGSYYVFGASYVCGTCTFDSEGQPFVEFTAGYTPGLKREAEEHQRWIEAFDAGELPPREEMGLPDFQYDERPYFTFRDRR